MGRYRFLGEGIESINDTEEELEILEINIFREIFYPVAEIACVNGNLSLIYEVQYIGSDMLEEIRDFLSRPKIKSFIRSRWGIDVEKQISDTFTGMMMDIDGLEASQKNEGEFSKLMMVFFIRELFKYYDIKVVESTRYKEKISLPIDRPFVRKALSETGISLEEKNFPKVGTLRFELLGIPVSLKFFTSDISEFLVKNKKIFPDYYSEDLKKESYDSDNAIEQLFFHTFYAIKNLGERRLDGFSPGYFKTVVNHFVKSSDSINEEKFFSFFSSKCFKIVYEGFFDTGWTLSEAKEFYQVVLDSVIYDKKIWARVLHNYIDTLLENINLDDKITDSLEILIDKAIDAAVFVLVKSAYWRILYDISSEKKYKYYFGKSEEEIGKVFDTVLTSNLSPIHKNALLPYIVGDTHYGWATVSYIIMLRFLHLIESLSYDELSDLLVQIRSDFRNFPEILFTDDIPSFERFFTQFPPLHLWR